MSKPGYLKGGLKEKYIIKKSNGKALDFDADYFVLRIDKDPHARVALQAYAESIKEDNPEFYTDLKEKLKEYDHTYIPMLLTIEDLSSLEHFKHSFETAADGIYKLCNSEKDDVVYGFELGRLYAFLRDSFIEMMDFIHNIKYGDE